MAQATEMLLLIDPCLVLPPIVTHHAVLSILPLKCLPVLFFHSHHPCLVSRNPFTGFLFLRSFLSTLSPHFSKQVTTQSLPEKFPAIECPGTSFLKYEVTFLRTDPHYCWTSVLHCTVKGLRPLVSTVNLFILQPSSFFVSVTTLAPHSLLAQAPFLALFASGHLLDLLSAFFMFHSVRQKQYALLSLWQ